MLENCHSDVRLDERQRLYFTWLFAVFNGGFANKVFTQIFSCVFSCVETLMRDYRSAACSQTLYFLFEVCRVRVINHRGFIDRQRTGAGVLSRARRCFPKERIKKLINVCVPANRSVRRVN